MPTTSTFKFVCIFSLTNQWISQHNSSLHLSQTRNKVTLLDQAFATPLLNVVCVVTSSSKSPIDDNDNTSDSPPNLLWGRRLMLPCSPPYEESGASIGVVLWVLDYCLGLPMWRHMRATKESTGSLSPTLMTPSHLMLLIHSSVIDIIMHLHNFH